MKNYFFALLFGTSFLFLACNHSNTSKNTATSVATADSTAQKDTVQQKINQLSNQLKTNANNPALYSQRANYYSLQKNYLDAMNDLKSAIRLDSTNANYLIALSDVYFTINQTGHSKEMLDKCIALNPKNKAALLKLAELFSYVQKYSQSMTYIDQVLQLDIHNSQAYFLKGMNFKLTHDTTNALSSLQTAVEQNPDYYDAYVELGVLYEAKKSKSALDYYNDALRVKPNDEIVLYDIGKYYQDAEDWNNAVETYTKLLQLYPNYKNAQFNLGVIHLLNLKVYDIAVKNFTDAIKLDSAYYQAYYGRGLSYDAMKNYNQAMIDFQRVSQINPNYKPVYESMKKIVAEIRNAGGNK
ncbi:MAG: tetratricopeptide repeat protein [Bacteroidia bacterium]